MEGGTESQGRDHESESSEVGLRLAFGIGIGGSFQISPPSSPPPPPLLAASSFFDRASNPFASSAFGSMGMEIGGGGGAFAQWQELQQQALNYKHFMASSTVPAAAGHHDLLSGAAITTHELALGKRLAGGGDPELGRCRRTDGKKWRCSREAAPGHKYCDRHVHRGRPARSRKPVDVPKAKPAASPLAATSSSSTSTKIAAAGETWMMLELPTQNVDPCREPRFVDVNLDWNSMFRHGMCFRREVSNPLDTPRHHHCHCYDGGALDSNFSDLNNHCFSFMSSDLSSMEEDAAMAGRRDLLHRSFIDAWSNQNPIPPASRYSAAAVEDDDADRTQMSLRFGGGDDSPFGGGPLAEVLHHTSAAAALSARNKRSCGALRLSAAASLPSGVLPKAAPAMVSRSESSGSSSPTFSAASVPAETAAMQWLVQRRK